LVTFSWREDTVCPDLHTLSAYIDGEIAVRWAKEIEEHLSNCRSCQLQLQRLKDVRETLSANPVPDSRKARERVWTRLQLHQEAVMYRSPEFLRRRIAVPLPMITAAAVLVLFMGFALVFLLARANVGTVSITKEPSGITEVHVQTSFKELQQILGSLESGSAGYAGQVVIPLPEDASFIMTGEPILTRDRIQSLR
jgi:hypothetical protein